MKARRNNNTSNNINNNNTTNLLLNNDDDEIQIVYNKDQDVDIIQQFQEEQNKKLSENIMIDKPTIKRTPSTPNLMKGKTNNEKMLPTVFVPTSLIINPILKPQKSIYNNI